jgi:hypothetical protein
MNIKKITVTTLIAIAILEITTMAARAAADYRRIEKAAEIQRDSEWRNVFKIFPHFYSSINTWMGKNAVYFSEGSRAEAVIAGLQSAIGSHHATLMEAAYDNHEIKTEIFTLGSVGCLKTTATDGSNVIYLHASCIFGTDNEVSLGEFPIQWQQQQQQISQQNDSPTFTLIDEN